ncbi:MAG: aspartate/glutamate racemase family protein, partial [Candidatus Aminicenantaceae bacterium]
LCRGQILEESRRQYRKILHRLAASGAEGIILGCTEISLLVRTATPLPASVTAWSVLLGVGVSVSCGLFFGIFPARKAAKTDPIISLRHE